MRNKHLIILIFSVLFVASCGSKKKTVTQKRERTAAPAKIPESAGISSKRYADVVEDYISSFAEIAKEEMRLYNIPASITLAQGILESGAGRGDLTRRANNHFGIKCHEWQGEKVYHDDDRRKECFRKYSDPKYSYRDHSLFLTERRRYAALFELDRDDYEGWAKGLREAGYATDRQYPNKLIDLIERYQLNEYDAEVMGNSKRIANDSRTIIVKANGKSHMVQKGDTLYSIARLYNTTVEALQKNNNLEDSNISIGQQLVVE
jgi:flagellum-specific peptidoglycan hydrolase FlgJ